MARVNTVRHPVTTPSRSLAAPRQGKLIPVLLMILVGSGWPVRAAAAPRAEGDVQARLKQTEVSMHLDGMVLGRVIDQLRTEYGLNIYVNHRALAAVGVDMDRRITLEIDGVSLETALQLILRDAGGDDAALAAVVEGEVVVISSEREAGRRGVVRLYDVSDLIESGYTRRRMLNTPLLRLKLTGAEWTGAGSGGGSALQNPFQGGAFGGADLMSAGAAFERLEALIDLIRGTVRPEQWREAGGTIGNIQRQGNRLVVTAGLAVHEEIETLLALLRGSRPATVDLHICLLSAASETAAQWRTRFAGTWPRLSAQEALKIEAERAAGRRALLCVTTTGPSGRGQFVSTLRQEHLVSGMQPVVDEAAVAYQPRVEPYTTGLELTLLPVLLHEGGGLNLSVAFALGEPGPVSQHVCESVTRLHNGDADRREVTVQLASVRMRTLVADVCLESGQAVLLTVPPMVTGGAADSSDTLFLMIRPTVR